MPVTGIVTNQVVTISPTTLQRILLILSAAPEPTIAELITCGVLTGIPKIDAIEISTIEVICESSAFIGFIRYIRPPRFRICRQSPIEPPNAKATAHEINTQLGTAKEVIRLLAAHGLHRTGQLKRQPAFRVGLAKDHIQHRRVAGPGEPHRADAV